MCLKQRDNSVSFQGGDTKNCAQGAHLSKSRKVGSGSVKKSNDTKLGQVFVDRACATLGLWNLPEKVLESFRDQMSRHLIRSDVEFVSRAKNIVCWFRALYLRNPLPDVDGYVMKGAFRKWAVPRLGKFSKKNTYLWNSVFNFKNLSLPVTRPVVLVNLQKHHADIQKRDTATEQDCIDAVDSIKPLLNEVAEKVGRKFVAIQDSLWSNVVGENPASNKASYACAQSEGGEAGDLYKSCFWSFRARTMIDWHSGSYVEKEWVPDHSWDDHIFERRLEMCDERMVGPLAPWSRIGRTLLIKRKRYDVNSAFDRKVLSWVATFGLWPSETSFQVFDGPLEWTAAPRHDVPGSKKLLKDLLDETVEDYLSYEWHENLLKLVDTEEPHVERRVVQHGDYVSDEDVITYPASKAYFDKWTRFHLDSILESDELPVCRVVAVCEPLKVRVITVSDALTNYFSTWYQKTVHKILKKYVCFQLLGGAPFSALVDDVARHSFGSGELCFDSSDFSGASNGTPKLFRELILDACTSRLPWVQRRIQEICNGNHIVVYPAWTFLLPVMQTRGTLMGRKTSFPILSLQVLASHVWALRLAGDKRNFWDLIKGVRVNGDDRITRYDKRTFDIYWDCCRRLQFGASLGKSYFHPKYANINSQSYHWTPDGFRKIGSLYCGLLHGQKKLATDVFDPTAVVTTLLDSCLDEKMEHRVLRMYLKLHKKSLQAHTCDRNLFLPEVLGGCGQRAPRGWSWVLTQDQQRLASYLYQEDLFLWDARVPHGPHLRVPCPERHAWDVEGLPTYWEQIRKLQDGDGEAKVPLSPQEKASHSLWLKDQELPVKSMLKRSFIRNAKIRRLPLARVDSPKVALSVTSWSSNGEVIFPMNSNPSWDYREQFRRFYPDMSAVRPVTFLQTFVLANRIKPRLTEWTTSVYDEEIRRNVVPLSGGKFWAELFRIGG